MLRLLNPLSNSRQACREFWMHRRDRERPLVRLPEVVHTAVFSPSGGGKGVSLVIPFLQTSPESCVVIDFKGENAAITAELRRKRFGHRIVLLDPFKVVTQTPDSLNPLDSINTNDPLALDQANALAKALVVRTGAEQDPHWSDSAEAWISALIGTVLHFAKEPADRSLQTVRDILTQPDTLNLAVQEMCKSNAWEGMLARRGGQLQHFVDRERASTLASATRHLRFLDTPAVARSTRSSTFDPRELTQGKMTVYLILPPAHMRAQSALLRMWIDALMRAAISGGLQEQQKVHFVLDEAASLGRLESLEDAIDKYRGYGVRLQFYYQSIGQLKACFPEGGDVTLLANCTQIYFGVNDLVLAEQVSGRIGEATIMVESSSRNRGWNENATYSGMQPSASQGSSGGSSTSWQQQARKLLKPEEIMQLPRRTAITFTPGVRPIRTRLIRYYEERNLGRRAGLLARTYEAVMVLFKSAAWSAAMVGAAIGLGYLLEIQDPGSFLAWVGACVQ